MKRFRITHRTVLTVFLLVVAVIVEAGPQDEVNVVASLTVYRDLAKEIVGERGEVEAIASARQDAHFVQAKPSYAMMISRADLLLATGLDLELWMPARDRQIPQPSHSGRRERVRLVSHRRAHASGAGQPESRRRRHPRFRQPACAHGPLEGGDGRQ